MKQILQLMKKIHNPALWLSSKSQLATPRAKQTLQNFGSCFVHIKSSRLYINLGAVIFFFKSKNAVAWLSSLVNLLQEMMIPQARGGSII